MRVRVDIDDTLDGVHDVGEADPAGVEGVHGDLVGRVVDGRERPTRLPDPPGEAHRRERLVVERLDDIDVPCDWTKAQSWEFEPLDDEAFPAVRLARQVGKAGGTFPAVYNAANEVAVDAFHAGRIGFVDIVDAVERVVEVHADAHTGSDFDASTVEGVLDADAWARGQAATALGLSASEPWT